MPVNKNALLRYRIINACLTNSMKRYPTLQQIVEKIEQQLGGDISESSVTKDFQQMRNIYDAPIKYSSFHKGYYYTEESFSIDGIPLNDEEREALDYSTALLHQLKGTRIFEQFENAINKVIEGYRVSNILGKSETQILQVEEPVKTGGSQWLELLLKSIVEKTALDIHYQGFGKEEKKHDFSPYLVKEYRNRWYVVGHSKVYGNILILALDRINGAKPNNEKYQPSEDFNPADFFHYSLGITQVHDAKPEKVVLEFTKLQAPYILSQPIHHSQNPVINNDDQLVIELEVYITHELKMMILGWGKEVKVLEPASLRDELRQCINEMLKQY